MTRTPSDIAFSPTVKSEQKRLGSRILFERMERLGGWPDRITPDLASVLSDCRSFFFATANADGQPYVQHRGGPAGFLKILDEETLAFADYKGNQQYLTIANLKDNPKAFIIVMDYIHGRRFKLWGTARVIEDDDALMTKLIDPAYMAAPERAIVLKLEAWDRNCPRHIPRMLPAEDVAVAIGRLQNKIAELEEQVALLKAEGTSEPGPDR